MPGHFLVRSPMTGQYLDPFFNGELLDERGCEERFKQVTGVTASVSFGPGMRPVSSKHEVLARMLNNLKSIYKSRNDGRSLEWVIRMRLAIPSVPREEVADLGEALGLQGRFTEGAAEIDAVAQDHPDLATIPGAARPCSEGVAELTHRARRVRRGSPVRPGALPPAQTATFPADRRTSSMPTGSSTGPSQITARDATDEELALVHTAEYIEAVKKAGSGRRGPWWEYGFGPGDNPIFPDMHEASARVAGASLVAAEAIVSGRSRSRLQPGRRASPRHARAGRAASASTTTRRWPSPGCCTTGWSGLPTSTSTPTTATACRRSSTTSPGC